MFRKAKTNPAFSLGKEVKQLFYFPKFTSWIQILGKVENAIAVIHQILPLINEQQEVFRSQIDWREKRVVLYWKRYFVGSPKQTTISMFNFHV